MLRLSRPSAQRRRLSAQCRSVWREPAQARPAYALTAYFSPSWTGFQADRGRDFSVIVDDVSG
ncbi:protein of unknown function [Thiomonas sp. Bio17B3]|nr:protein of unknown function [Thiomonas sp. Bio17B3]VDY17585.1 protein of unknown function [Thiomonas sp. CB2]